MLLNRERASAIMAAEGLEALVASTAENVTYATGYANWPIYTFKSRNDIDPFSRHSSI